MVWSVLSNGKAIEAPTPTRDQIAAAEAALTGAHPRPAPRHMPPGAATTLPPTPPPRRRPPPLLPLPPMMRGAY